MQKTSEDRFDVTDFLPFLDPLIRKWFNSRYEGLTEPQRKAIPLIHNRENVLVSSPTGTGKTLTGFLSVINELFILSREGRLEDRIYCLYVSPLKALANDINKNLDQPLSEIREVALSEGLDFPQIRAAVRTGDTPQNERAKMLRKPPHILITTPESFSLALSAPKFREKLKDLRYVIIDEIHEISSTKRGALLSLNLERLSKENSDFIRIGLSATQAPIETIASYLCGFDGEKPRRCSIIEVDTKKYLDLSTITPVNDLTKSSYEVANDRMYEILVDLINSHNATIIFTNTRSGTENVAMRLKARGVESIEAHHSSLGKDTRIEVENKLKNGELKCVITSTSLELGIDVGYIDLVVQIGSPKSVSKGLQRIGRSGHGINDLSKGRFVVFDLDDLVECAVLTRAAYERNIDRVHVPLNSLDVLSQVLVGMSLEKVYRDREAFDLVRNSYNFHDLSWDDFISTLRYLAGKIEAGEIYSKIWYDEAEGTFGKRRSTRMLYFMNIGTIPEEADYKVISDKGRHLGQLSDKFAERLKNGDIFVLGARTYMYLRTVQNRIYVKDATGMRPTVPSWSGEMLPRSYDLGTMVGKFRSEVLERLQNKEDVSSWLIQNYHVDTHGANSIISYIEAQSKFDLPTDSHLLVEGYVDESKIYSMIFHVPLGRRINDALSRAYAQAISKRFGTNLRVTITDDGFMLGSEKKIPIKEAVKTLASSSFEDTVRSSLANTEVFKQRFRHCATRSLMVLRKYKGYDISIVRQQLRSDKLLKTLSEMRNFPVIKETYHEIMNEMMDVPMAKKYIADVVEKGNFHVIDYSGETSPFSYGLILSGVSDMVLMEDRSQLLRELQSKILDKIYGPGKISVLITDQKKVDEYFRLKVPRISTIDDYREFARYFLLFDPFKNRFNSPFPYAETGVTDLTEELIGSDEIISVHVRGTLYTSVDNYPIVWSLFRQMNRTDQIHEDVLHIIEGKTFAEIKKESDLEEQKLREVLSDLESSFLIRRTISQGKQVFISNHLSPDPVPSEKASADALRLVLGSYGPLTYDEIQIRLPVGEELLKKGLDILTSGGEVINDFITPVFAKQYMLKSDLESILGGGNENSVESRVTNFMEKVPNIGEYFNKYGYCYGNDNLTPRLNEFKEDELFDLMAGGNVSYGRFIKHRLCFISDWLARSLHSLRMEPLKDEEKTILDLIASGVSDESDLSKRSSMEIKIVRQIVKNLEFHIMVKRSQENSLIPFLGEEPSIPKGEAVSVLVEKFGPISRRELMNNFWFYADAPLKEAGLKGVVLRGDLYYGFKERGRTSNTAGIFSVLDPVELYLGKKYFREISYNRIFIVNGREEGSLNIQNSNGIVWVTQVSVPVRLSGMLLEELRQVATRSGNTPLCIEIPQSGFGDADIGGFSQTDNFLVSDDLNISPLSMEDLFAYASEMHLSSDQNAVYENVKKEILGFRNEVEASYSGLRNVIFRGYFQSRLLFQFNGPFTTQALGTMEVISLYRAIRNGTISSDDQKIIHTIIDMAGATEQQIRGSLGRSVSDLKVRLGRLFEKCIVAKDFERRYIFVPERYSRDEALQTLLSFLLDRMGFFDFAILKYLLGESYNSDVEKIAEIISKSGQAMKCILPEHQKVIFLKKSIRKGRHRGHVSRIVAPKDILSLYFSDLIKREAGTLNSYVLVEEGVITASLNARRNIKKLKASHFNGTDEGREKLVSELNSLGFAVSFN